MDFRKFNENNINNKINDIKQDNSYDFNNSNNYNNKNDIFTTFNNLKDKYSGFTYDELKKEVLNTYIGKLHSGEMDLLELESFYNNISPFLDEESKNELQKVLVELKHEY